MKQILHVINNLEIGGAQKLLVDLLPLQNKMYRVSVLTLEKSESEFCEMIKKSGIICYSANSKSLYSLKMLFVLFRIIRKKDLIHVHLFPSLYWVALLHFFCKNKIVYTEHSTYNRRRNRKCLRFIEYLVYACYDRVISISGQTQNNLLSWLKHSESKKFRVIHNGVNLSKFYPLQTEKMIIPPLNLLMISRFSPQKDQVTVIKAFVLLLKRYPLLNLHFVGDGENLNRCKSLAIELELSNNIHFWGNQTNIPQFIHNCFCGIQSSYWEGFGLTAVEFMACGKPIIASNVDGLKQIVEGAGILFAKGDEQDLAVKISSILDSEDYYHKVSNACLDKSKIYNIDTMAQEYELLYNELLE